MKFKIIALIVVFSLLASGFSQAQDFDPDAIRERAARATVFIMNAFEEGGQLFISCVGSGTLVSADGLILTNAHITPGNSGCRTDRIIIALPVDLEGPPALTYQADLVIKNDTWDLAILRITRNLAGQSIDMGTLLLPFVDLGDSNALRREDLLLAAGYSELGEQPVSTRLASVIGFMAEPQQGERAWIKLDTQLPGTFSGGGIYNAEGRLVGVPTGALTGSAGEVADCRRIADTTLDGVVDQRDVCIPMGTAFNMVRPAQLARSLLRAATLSVQSPAKPQKEKSTTDRPTFSRFLFATGTNAAGQPVNIVSSLPEGASSLYVFFDYANMAPGMAYEMRVTVNGVINPLYTLTPTWWSGGENGIWYIGTSGIRLPTGTYEFAFFIDGSPAGDARITIGGEAQPLPAFSDIVFGIEDSVGNIISTGYVLPASVSIASARFVYQNMPAGLPWSERWYFQGMQVRENTESWTEEDGPGGAKTIRVEQPGGLAPGRYRLELYIAESMAATADFWIVGERVPQGTTVFSTPLFASEIGSRGEPAAIVGGVFPEATGQVYAFLDWRNLANGIELSERWLVDNDLLLERRLTWDAGTDGSGFRTVLEGSPALADGTYTLEIGLANEILARADAVIGSGTIPSERLAPASGVQMTGQIVDSETGRGVPGALFIVLFSEYDVSDFDGSASMIYSQSLADNAGNFVIPQLLEPDAFYSVFVFAEGYLPLSMDGIEVAENTPSPMVLSVELSRD